MSSIVNGEFDMAYSNINQMVDSLNEQVTINHEYLKKRIEKIEQRLALLEGK